MNHWPDKPWDIQDIYNTAEFILHGSSPLTTHSLTEPPIPTPMPAPAPTPAYTFATESDFSQEGRLD
jgi:hypothetical protein